MEFRKGCFMKSARIPLFLAGLACLVVFLAPAVKAGDWDQKTMLYFSEPVEIPTATLPAGNYIFKLMDSPGDRQIVQVLSADEHTVYATIEAVPSFRSVAFEKTTIVFQQRRAGSPRMIKDWFYPTDRVGHEFVYWNASQSAIANSKPEASANTAPDAEEPQSVEPEPERDSSQQVNQSEESSYMKLVRERQRQ